MRTIHGQALDLQSSDPNDAFNTRLSMDRYRTIVKYKTSYYSFVLPIRCALYIAGIRSRAAHEKAKEILFSMGFLFQVQDDYLDCFGDPDVTGKIGSDIQDNKCTWFTAKIIQVYDDHIHKTLEAHYGKEDESDTEKVKQLYENLGMKSIYSTFERQTIENIESKILEQKLLRREPFLELLHLITNRKQ